MQQRLSWVLMALLLGYTPSAGAVQWVKVTENAVNDRFFIDSSSIQRKGAAVVYWEYREFLQPNNAFLETPVNKPVYGVVLRWSLDCQNKTQRLERLNAFDKTRQLIRKFDYGTKGSVAQPQAGSSAFKVVNFVCEPKSTAKPQ
jgi:hypothetical protein